MTTTERLWRSQIQINTCKHRASFTLLFACRLIRRVCFGSQHRSRLLAFLFSLTVSNLFPMQAVLNSAIFRISRFVDSMLS
ncbi:hypothetical protein LF1_11860 [Rubripirellula obstinata]|uniref:Uncharacterized protein n=1 Tax=Rubripirellula obstinata TaxID=406547 RepID=A0A5B1CHH2_9BACT|nr:hypothetical protein LF1_11860 [Rubripirellula obstinata]